MPFDAYTQWIKFNRQKDLLQSQNAGLYPLSLGIPGFGGGMGLQRFSIPLNQLQQQVGLVRNPMQGSYNFDTYGGGMIR